MSKQIIIWGGGGHARVVHDCLISQNKIVAGYIDDTMPDSASLNFPGCKYLGSRTILASLEVNECQLIIAVGNNQKRVGLWEYCGSLGFSFCSTVHGTALFGSRVLIGDGSFVGPGAILNTGTHIGNNVIINSGAIVEHDCEIGDFAHVGPGCVVGAGTVVGRGAWLKAGTIVSGHFSIPEWYTSELGQRINCVPL